MDFWQASSDVFKYLTTPEKIRGAMELTTTNIVPTNFVPPHSAKIFKTISVLPILNTYNILKTNKSSRTNFHFSIFFIIQDEKTWDFFDHVSE